MGVAFAEGEVTRARREFKLLLEPDEGRAFLARLCREHGGCEPQHTRIVSIYFDRPGQPLAQRAARRPEDCVKVRTKEYFPDREGETPRVVFEVKRERDGLTHKERRWLPRRQLRRWLEEGAARPLLPGPAEGRWQTMVAVSYQRAVVQVEAGWRVTVDTGIRFHPVTEALALGPEPVTPERLWAPFADEPRVVVEVKHQPPALPRWLGELGEREAQRYSKFVEAVQRLERCRGG